MEDAFRKAGYSGASHLGDFDLGKDYAARAEKVILDLKANGGQNYQKFTTSKIRNILARVSEIYNDVIADDRSETLSSDLQGRIEYLKVRLVYECGREPKVVKPFVDRADLIKLLNGIGSSRQNFIDFARYMEALVAYHRFHGGE